VLLPVGGGVKPSFVRTVYIMCNQKPVVFVVGDSISIHYGPFLEELLEGRFTYARKTGVGEALKNLDIPEGANGGDSAMVLAYVREKVLGGKWKPDVFLLNCGLHDIKRYRPDACQVPLDKYAANLKEIARLVAGESVKLAWIRTTPVVEHIHNSRSKDFKRYKQDVDAYNDAADKVMRQLNVPIADLHGFTEAFGEAAFCDHVHFVPDVRQKQARFLADFVSDLHQKGYF
jgi:lysophospholipase L1-like esterase